MATASTAPSAGATDERATSVPRTALQVTEELTPVPIGTRLTLSIDPDLSPPAIPTNGPTFPIRVLEDGSTLVDESGRPFLITGDAAWSLLVQLDVDSVDVYLRERQAMGFNTILVNLIEHKFSDDPPNNVYGEAPFAEPGDFSRPQVAYFDRAHDMIAQAAQHELLVLLAPAYLGYDGGDEGWYSDMVNAGPGVLFEYGRFVGERFADLDNIVWVDGGDFTPPDNDLELVAAVRDGIVAGGSTQLRTAHWSPETSANDVGIGGLDINTTYTYGPVYVASSDDDPARLPHLVIESRYEDDVFEATDRRLRSQVYEPILTGAVGSVYGHGDIWRFTDGWRDALAAPGARAMAYGRAFFESQPWWSLVTDVRTSALVRNPGEFGAESFVVTAATPDRSVVIAVVPDERDVEVDLGKIAGLVTVRWYDPSAGVYVAAAGVTQADPGVLIVPHPGANADGAEDWVLDVRVQQLSAPQP